MSRFYIHPEGIVVLKKVAVRGGTDPSRDAFRAAISSPESFEDVREWLREQGHDGVASLHRGEEDGTHTAVLYYMLEPDLLFHFKLRFG